MIDKVSMRHFVLMIFPLMILRSFGQNNKPVLWGGGFGWGVSSPVYQSGDAVANFRFQVNPFASFALFISARKDFNNHWALMGSAEIRSVGFEYTFKPEEYSLIKFRPKPLRHELTVLQFPVLVIYKTGLNCMNKRWVFGLGLTPAFIEHKNINSVAETGLNGHVNFYEIKTAGSATGLCFGKWMIGREKVCKNGNVFMWGMEHLFVRQQAAISEINYTYNGKNYHHVFRNPGTYAGIFFRYLFGKNHIP